MLLSMNVEIINICFMLVVTRIRCLPAGVCTGRILRLPAPWLDTGTDAFRYSRIVRKNATVSLAVVAYLLRFSSMRQIGKTHIPFLLKRL
jgi:hypothetical protein